MARIEELAQRGQYMNRLLEVWGSAVKATHTFLSDADFSAIEPEVPAAIAGIAHFCCFFDDDGTIQGFVGVAQQKIEMLFVHAKARGRGIGKQLLRFAIAELGARYVDVNEQNEQGVGFYEHMGFVVMSRSALDEQGRPFPLLHLQLNRS